MPSKSKRGLLFDTPGWSLKESVPSPQSNKPSKPRPHKKLKSNQSEPVQQSQTLQPSKPEIKSQPIEPILNSNNLQTSVHPLAQSLLSSSLSGPRFRVLNETLYTSTGPQAAQLFSSEPSNPNFAAYHLGFRHQTKHWPHNPVNLIAAELRQQFTDRHQAENVVVADLGCGEAPLARLLSEGEEVKEHKKAKADDQRQQQKPGPRFRVLSYDLVPDREGWVMAAECSTRVPLPGSQADSVQNAVVDVVVCCLSLMGTNWVGMVLEARRILKLGGQLKVAEVTSRFVDLDKFVDFIKLIGFSTPTQDKSNTHFILFNFTKTLRSNPTQLKMNRLYEEPQEHDHLISRGEKLLKPCIYKRR